MSSDHSRVGFAGASSKALQIKSGAAGVDYHYSDCPRYESGKPETALEWMMRESRLNAKYGRLWPCTCVPVKEPVKVNPRVIKKLEPPTTHEEYTILNREALKADTPKIDHSRTGWIVKGSRESSRDMNKLVSFQVPGVRSFKGSQKKTGPVSFVPARALPVTPIATVCSVSGAKAKAKKTNESKPDSDVKRIVPLLVKSLLAKKVHKREIRSFVVGSHYHYTVYVRELKGFRSFRINLLKVVRRYCNVGHARIQIRSLISQTLWHLRMRAAGVTVDQAAKRIRDTNMPYKYYFPEVYFREEWVASGSVRTPKLAGVLARFATPMECVGDRAIVVQQRWNLGHQSSYWQLMNHARPNLSREVTYLGKYLWDNRYVLSPSLLFEEPRLRNFKFARPYLLQHLTNWSEHFQADGM